MKAKPNPQTGAAMALAQLLLEHPDLPAMEWQIATDGVLRADTVFHDGTDVRLMAAALADVTGLPVDEFGYVARDGRERLSLTISGSWRDVRVCVSLISAPVVSAMAVKAVAA